MSDRCCGSSDPGSLGPEGKLFVMSGILLFTGSFLRNETLLLAVGSWVIAIAVLGLTISVVWTY